MAVINTPSYTNFKIWWENHNKLGASIGDLDLLNSDIDPLFGSATDENLVSAINSLLDFLSNQDRLLLVHSICLT